LEEKMENMMTTTSTRTQDGNAAQGHLTLTFPMKSPADCAAVRDQGLSAPHVAVLAVGQADLSPGEHGARADEEERENGAMTMRAPAARLRSKPMVPQA
jgi:hypothetical protein